MNDTGVIVTYSGSEALLDSTAFAQLIATFAHHLPLRNLHWKPSASFNAGHSGSSSPFDSSLPHPSSIRTIQSLGVRLEPLADTLLRTKLKPETRHLFLLSLLERPYCHLYFVVCDDSDTYRSQIRNDIRNWLSTIQTSPILSAANVTAKGFQGVESLHRHKNGSTSSLTNGRSTPRSSTPPIRPDTPTKEVLGDEGSSASSKEKAAPPSPEYLIVVISPPEGSPLPSSVTGGNAPAPLPNSNSHSDLTEKQNAANKSGLGRFYSNNTSAVKNSVIDKVKTDFNTSKRERVIHLTRLPSLASNNKSQARHSDPTIFAELQTRLKECVSATFDAVVETQGDIVKREGQKKHLPGWNYCKWMAGVECIAGTFEGVGLYSDALSQFEDIDAGFLQCQQENNLPFFSHSGGDTPGDDSAPLLDIGKKNYRDMILRNEITLFDFRNYVFAKRAILLGKLGRVAQVMSETPIFLNRVALMLKKESLPSHFVESWIFSCSIDVVEQCQAWLVARGDMSPLSGDVDLEEKTNGTTKQVNDARLSAAFHSAKAELLDLARRQLDKVGIAVGHLPSNLPFSLSLPHHINSRDRQLPPIPDEKQDDALKRITRQELLSAIDSREVFDLHYISLTERIISSWNSGGRIRNVKRLRCIIGSLDFIRERYAEAYTKFKTLSEPYGSERWTNVEAYHLAMQLESHSRIGQAYDRSWALVVMALLSTQAGQSSMSSKKSSDYSSRWLDAAFLCQQLREHTPSIPQEIPVSKFAPVVVRVESQKMQIDQLKNQDGMSISVSVVNHLPCSLRVDDVRMCLVNGSGREIWLVSGSIEIAKGINQIALSCFSINHPGVYMVDISQIRIAKVIVQYQHRNAKDKVSSPILIDVPEDIDALDVDLQLGQSIALDQCRTSTMTVWSGRNDVDKMSITLRYRDSGEQVKGFMEAKTDGNQSDLRWDESERAIILHSIASNTSVKLAIPLLDFEGPKDGIVHFIAEVIYSIKGDSEAKNRIARFDLNLSIGLPLGVNVQDYFRYDQLFSKFLITAGAGGNLRLGKVSLLCEDGADKDEKIPFEIVGPTIDQDILVTAADAASFLFRIKKTKEVKSKNRNLRLTLSYQTASESIVQRLRHYLEEALKSRDRDMSLTHKRFIERILMPMIGIEDQSFILTHTISDRQLRRRLCQASVHADDMAEIARQVLESMRDDKGLSSCKEVDTWRELSLVLDVPCMTLVNAVTITLAETNKVAHVGQVIHASLHIETSFHWDIDEMEKQDAQRGNDLLTVHANESTEDEDGDFQDAKSDTDAVSPIAAKVEEERSRINLSIDVQCDFVNWLLVGLKRHLVELMRPKNSSESVMTTMEVSLVPLRAGSLILPTVVIWPLTDPIDKFPTSHAHRSKQDNAIQLQKEKDKLNQKQSIGCDTHITNEGQTVVVIPSASPGTDRRTFWMKL